MHHRNGLPSSDRGPRDHLEGQRRKDEGRVRQLEGRKSGERFGKENRRKWQRLVAEEAKIIDNFFKKK